MELQPCSEETLVTIMIQAALAICFEMSMVIAPPLIYLEKWQKQLKLCLNQPIKWMLSYASTLTDMDKGHPPPPCFSVCSSSFPPFVLRPLPPVMRVHRRGGGGTTRGVDVTDVRQSLQSSL